MVQDGFRLGLTGCGAQTALGLTAEASAAAVRAGITRFGEHAYAVDEHGDRVICAAVPGIPGGAGATERLARLAVPAAREAVLLLRSVPGKRPALPMVLALPAPRPALQEDYAARLLTELRTELQETCDLVSTKVIATGHAAGLGAIHACVAEMRHHGSYVGLVGGVDSYLDGETLEQLEHDDQLHTMRNPWGFIPGEAACFCLLLAPEVDGAWPGFDRARLALVAQATETNCIKTDTVCLGEGLTTALHGALEALPDAARITDTICDLNGEPYRADEFVFALLRMSERFVDGTDFAAPADCWGDVGAASGLLFLMLACAAHGKGYARGRHTLMWASSEGGDRAAALVQAGVAEGEK